MFLKTNPSQTGYTHSGQRAGGLFLILTTPPVDWSADDPLGRWSALPIRAFVRSVKMRQCGHFMTGDCTIAGHRIALSGAYGADGLTRDVPAEVYALGVELPAELRAAWNTGGGHNSVGSEAPDMRAWALAHLSALRAAGRRPA